MLHEKSRYFTAIPRILVQLQICQRGVKDRLIKHNIGTDHVTIRSELIYLFAGKVAGTVIWNRGPGSTRPKNRGFMTGPGNKPAQTMQVGFLAWSGTELNQTASQTPD
jgi:hypothetical protein